MSKQPYLKEHRYKDHIEYEVYKFDEDYYIWVFDGYNTKQRAFEALKIETENYFLGKEKNIIMYNPNKGFYKKEKFVNYKTCMVFVVIITVLLIIFI